MGTSESTTGLLGRLRALAPVDMAFAATVDVPGTSFVLDRFDGARGDSLRGVRSAVGDGLGGRCIALRRPVYVADYVSARGISHQYDGAVSAEGLRSIIAVPVLDGGVVREVVYAGSRGRDGFGERLVDRTVEVVRRHAGPRPDGRLRGAAGHRRGRVRARAAPASRGPRRPARRPGARAAGGDAHPA